MEHLVTSAMVHHGYLAVFLLMLVSSICIPIPSEVVMLFGGAAASGGLDSSSPHHVTVWGIIAWGLAGNVIGSLIAYAIGRYAGRTVIEHWGRYVLLKPHDIDRAEAFFAKRGDIAVLVGRVIPVIRAFVSLPAGIAEMRIVRFTVLTFIGCIPWVVGLAWIGDAAGRHWPRVEHDVKYVTYAVVLVVIVLLARWVIRRLRERRTLTAAE